MFGMFGGLEFFTCSEGALEMCKTGSDASGGAGDYCDEARNGGRRGMKATKASSRTSERNRSLHSGHSSTAPQDIAAADVLFRTQDPAPSTPSKDRRRPPNLGGMGTPRAGGPAGVKSPGGGLSDENASWSHEDDELVGSEEDGGSGSFRRASGSGSMRRNAARGRSAHLETDPRNSMSPSSQRSVMSPSQQRLLSPSSQQGSRSPSKGGSYELGSSPSQRGLLDQPFSPSSRKAMRDNSVIYAPSAADPEGPRVAPPGSAGIRMPGAAASHEKEFRKLVADNSTAERAASFIRLKAMTGRQTNDKTYGSPEQVVLVRTKDSKVQSYGNTVTSSQRMHKNFSKAITPEERRLLTHKAECTCDKCENNLRQAVARDAHNKEKTNVALYGTALIKPSARALDRRRDELHDLQ
eukprot:CAMPEP_0173409338 /NCGR_PEP_ID=MMETSP1356-20130122/71902_1 /TAXON_ID=77927 ORGANISM="Hemiselmis virescens, Strain PCC157" /NCGR_SAMPLE_ID=MMETSP1356 /ASSEMBLY_ACC=CAM_ASM_000847 /LENGTH=409 /DNA_ID=CAMNT_0014370785 /DNA_START=1 /DNA_END=1227 /DNA_ORIENTATION=+